MTTDTRPPEPVRPPVRREARVPRERIDKFAERRTELGEAALTTLATLGYARTSLREIAQNSEFSHGVLHYYFNDKVDLIVCSVRQYKSRCVTRYDQATIEATDFDGLLAAFQATLVRTLIDEAPMHRLWYDLRAQAMFEPAFQADVAAIDASLEHMVWRVLTRFAELAGEPLAVSPQLAYATFDGLFQRALLRHLSGEGEAAAGLERDVAETVGLLFPARRPGPVRSPEVS